MPTSANAHTNLHVDCGRKKIRDFSEVKTYSNFRISLCLSDETHDHQQNCANKANTVDNEQGILFAEKVGWSNVACINWLRLVDEGSVLSIYMRGSGFN